MKKLVFFIILTMGLSLLMACNKEDSSITKEQLTHEFSLSEIPKSLLDKDSVPAYINDYVNLNKYKTEDFLKIYSAFEHTHVLLTNFNAVILDLVRDEEIILGDNYQVEDYTYIIDRVGNNYQITINQYDDLVLQAKTNLNGEYLGEFHLDGDDLEFTINDNKLNLTYYDADDGSTVNQELIINDNYLRMIIIYQDANEEYFLTAIGNEQYSGIYMSDVRNDTKRMTISDRDGYALYESYEDDLVFSGFHLHALENYTNITQIDDSVFRVDDIDFTYEEELSNLFNVNFNFLDQDDQIISEEVLLLGQYVLGYPDIITLRSPFTSPHYEVINQLSNELYNYMYNSEY